MLAGIHRWGEEQLGGATRICNPTGKLDAAPRPSAPLPSPPQVKIFGSFTRWSQDVAPPLDGAAPGRSILTTAAAALRYAVTSPAGPVHLNMQVRNTAPYRAACLRNPEPCWPLPWVQGSAFCRALGSAWQPRPPPLSLPSAPDPASFTLGAVPRAPSAHHLPLEPGTAAGRPGPLDTLAAALHNAGSGAAAAGSPCSAATSHGPAILQSLCGSCDEAPILPVELCGPGAAVPAEGGAAGPAGGG